MFISYPILEKETSIVHFTSTRIGGVSDGCYSSLNLGKFGKDSAENIEKNFSILYSTFNLNRENTHIPFQTHEDKVLKIDKHFLELSEEEKEKKLYGNDAVITNLPNQCILVSTADCVPILLYDPVTKSIAAIHAGWKGTLLRIAKKSIEAMVQAYNSNPKDVIAVIGVSISADLYEVGEELKTAFQANGFNIETIFNIKNKKLYLDLWQANKEILIESGLTENNIEISGLCSYSDSEKFFSARRQSIISGRMLSGIMLK